MRKKILFLLLFIRYVYFINGSEVPVMERQPVHNKSAAQCGVPLGLRGLISGGKTFSPGRFPWMVALFYDDGVNEPKYFCGGTLVSLKHILTGEILNLYSSFKIL